MWQATNEKARDFRVDTIGRTYRSQPLEAEDDGEYVAHVEDPAEGWKAFFVQLEFDIGAPRPLRLTTPVRVVPNELPFADTEPPLIELSE